MALVELDAKVQGVLGCTRKASRLRAGTWGRKLRAKAVVLCIALLLEGKRTTCRHQCAKSNMLEGRARLGTRSTCRGRASGGRGGRSRCGRGIAPGTRCARRLGTRSACRGGRGGRSRCRRGIAPRTRCARRLGTCGVVQRGAGAQPRAWACLANGALLVVVACVYVRGPVEHRTVMSYVRTRPQRQSHTHLAPLRVAGAVAALLPRACFTAWLVFMESGKFCGY